MSRSIRKSVNKMLHIISPGATVYTQGMGRSRGGGLDGGDRSHVSETENPLKSQELRGTNYKRGEEIKEEHEEEEEKVERPEEDKIEYM